MNSNTCILFVDDEKDICEKIAFAFELEDFKTLTANSGNEAIEVLKKTPDIHFIISDMRMANGDGLFLLNHVTQHFPKIKMIILSGFSEVSEAEVLKLGALYFLHKPNDIDALIELVKSHCAS